MTGLDELTGLGHTGSGPGLPASHPVRALAGRTAVIAGVLSGAVSAAYVALARQGASTATVIERAAVAAALASGAISSESVEAVELPVPVADGWYAADGRHLADSPHGTNGTDGTDDADSSERASADHRSDHGLTLVMIGDSTAVGYGCRTVTELPGVALASDLATWSARPVRLRTVGRSGCGAADLARQIGLIRSDPPDIAVIVVGANDIRDKVPPQRSARLLGLAVAELHALGVQVVVGTCPDFGVISSLPQPLRSVLGRWSQVLGALQAHAAQRAGARVVVLGKVMSHEFAGHREFFADDGFHPSGTGYARAVRALAPAVRDAGRQQLDDRADRSDARSRRPRP